MAHSFLWPDRAGETTTIIDVIMFRNGDVALIPNQGPSITVTPTHLPPFDRDILVSGITALANYHHSNADRLDKAVQQLALMRPVARGF